MGSKKMYRLDLLRLNHHPDDENVGHVMNHLIEAEDPPECASMDVVKATQIVGARAEAVHGEMNDKVDHR